MIEKRKRGRPSKKDQELVAAAAKFHVSLTMNAKAKLKAQEEINQRLKRDGDVNLRYVAERLRDIKNMDEVEAFYKECVYNIGINTLRNGKADG